MREDIFLPVVFFFMYEPLYGFAGGSKFSPKNNGDRRGRDELKEISWVNLPLYI